jgi:hypothetical protein
MATIFYDAVTPASIPAGKDAVLYWDGDYAATPEQARRFAHVRWNSVLGGEDAARHTGCLDYEKYNASMDDPGRLVEWVDTRAQMNCLARVYVNLSTLKQAYAQVGRKTNVRWWLATLDGAPWSAATLVLVAKRDYGVSLDESTVWGVQYAGGLTAKYDESLLLGRSF